MFLPEMQEGCPLKAAFLHFPNQEIKYLTLFEINKMESKTGSKIN
jgi:hypothetical protein